MPYQRPNGLLNGPLVILESETRDDAGNVIDIALRITDLGRYVWGEMDRTWLLAEFNALPVTPQGGGFWRLDGKLCWGLNEHGTQIDERDWPRENEIEH